jgi:hypothetical protein
MQFPSGLSSIALGKHKEKAMRFLLPAIGIAALVVTGTALETHFSSNDVAMAETTLGVPVYDIQANPNYVKTLPEQEIPLP